MIYGRHMLKCYACKKEITGMVHRICHPELREELITKYGEPENKDRYDFCYAIGIPLCQTCYDQYAQYRRTHESI